MKVTLPDLNVRERVKESGKVHHIKRKDKFHQMLTLWKNTLHPPKTSNRLLLNKDKSIFTCFANWCEGSACSQVRFGSSARVSGSWCGQCCKPAQLDLYYFWFESPKAAPWTCTSWIDRMERELLVGGRLCVSWDVLPEFVVPSPLPAQQFFPPPSFCLPFFSGNWSHQCLGLNCCHSTQINHLVRKEDPLLLHPLLWGKGAWPVYGSLQLTGLGVCLLGCQVTLEEGLRRFCTQTFTPSFLQESSLFLQSKTSFVVFPMKPISDSILHWCHC